ncbi:MAG: hypothetical protein ACR2OD_10510 [Gaiellaceae bacterium]
MDERDRADTEGDIEFEFFDDPPTTEARPGDVRSAAGPEPATPKKPPRTPMRGVRRAHGGTSPTLRLALLIAGLILVAIIIVIAIASCGGGKKAEFQSYLESVSEVTTASDMLGENANTVLFSRGVPTELTSQLQGLAEQQQQLTDRAIGLDVPGDLVDQHESLVTAMQLRTNGLSGLSRAFGQLAELGSDVEAGAALAEQAARLTASDVVYADLFAGPARSLLAEKDIQGVEVPSSTFAGNADALTESTLTEVVSNLGGGGGTDAGLRGTSLISVTAQPADLQLSAGQPNTLTLSSDLAFAVTVRNSGDVQLTDVRVRFTLQQSGDRVRKNEVIDVLNPDQSRIVQFGDFADLNIADPSVLTIAVLPVDGETNLDNNSETYEIILSLS